jgi:MHS family shikimate/dehydroshikimate transporter-like MFS transporter
MVTAEVARPRDDWAETRGRLVPAAVVGSVLEWYDMFIYAQAAALIFPALFFPELSPTVGIVAAFATYGAGYLARPLGAVIFGHIGDKHGRKAALVGTLILMGVATTLIGFLPTYAAVGVAAPILLVALRTLQGVGAGAEYAGAFVAIAESAPVNRRGFWSSLPIVGVYGGIILSSLVATITFSLDDEALMSWGWRIPFLASILLIIVGIYLRWKVSETPVFRRMAREKAVRKLPSIQVFKSQPRRLFVTALLSAPIAFNSHVTLTYGLTYSVERGVTAREALIGTLIGCLFGIMSAPLAGRLSDTYGRKPVYIWVCLLSALAAFPYLALMRTGEAPLLWLAQAFLVGAIIFALAGAQGAFLTELFTAEYRYSGVALSRELSTSVLAAIAPIAAIGLTVLMGGEPWLVAGAMVLVNAVCIAATLALPETRGADLMAETSTGPDPLSA